MSKLTLHYKPFDDYSDWFHDEEVADGALLENLRELKNTSITKYDEAVKFVTKAAAVDTGAIEKLYETDRGFTYAVAAQVNTIDFIQNRKGDDFAVHFTDQLNTYEYILDHATGSVPLTQSRLRELHATICAHQDTYRVRVGDRWESRILEKGSYKNSPNTVTKSDGTQHFYCPPDQVSQEMQRLLDQTTLSQFREASSIVQAAYVHHALTVIHPFSDGNGRVSRAVASIFLICQFGVPFLIHADQREIYFDALEEADKGNTKEFLFFVYDRVWETIELISQIVKYGEKNKMDSLAELVRGKYATDAAEYDEGVDHAAQRLSKACLNALKAEADIQKTELGEYIKIEVSTISGGKDLNAKAKVGYREVYEHGIKISVYVSRKKPSESDSLRYVYDLIVPINSSPESLILVIQAKPEPQKDAIYARISECHTTPAKTLTYRIESWAKNVIRDLIREFVK